MSCSCHESYRSALMTRERSYGQGGGRTSRVTASIFSHISCTGTFFPWICVCLPRSVTSKSQSALHLPKEENHQIAYSPSTSTLLLSKAITKLLFNWFFALLNSVWVTPPLMGRVSVSSW